MKKRALPSFIIASLVLIGVINANWYDQSSKVNTVKSAPTTSAVNAPAPTCDGTSVTANCSLDEISYKTYIYHPAVTKKTHTETVTTYKEKVIGYCTLCNDGTRSPSCATGRGACSWHGGVAQWDAPITSRVPVYTNKTVIDAPAKKAYYERVLDK